MDKILLIGGGGHCKVVADAVTALGKYEIAGIVDKKKDAEVPGIRVIGNDSDLELLHERGFGKCVICVGSVGKPDIRIKIRAICRNIGFTFPVIIHPKAIVAPGVIIGAGSFIAAGAVINPGTVIGEQCIINTGAVIDHDCRIGEFCHIAPGAVLSGEVTVGDRSHIGTGACAIQGTRIGRDSIIGAGSVVVSDMPADSVCFGVPCKKIKANA